MFDWTQYTGNIKWLSARTFFMTRHGSHAYGTNLPTSDLDLRGIFVAPKEYYLGFTQVVEQVTCKEPDLVVFDVQKFFKLAADANPNALELIFTDPSDHQIVTPQSELLLENRHLFLSRKAKYTFSGYAHAQMKRILTHRRWLLDPPKKPPTREDFGLPRRTEIPADQLAAARAAVLKQIDRWGFKDLEDIDPATRQRLMDRFENSLLEMTRWTFTDREEKQWVAAADFLGFSTNFIEVLDKERRYESALRNWNQFNLWERERNPARAALEKEFGYDCKHGMHLVRLSRRCLGLLKTADLQVRCDDAEELLEIRNGGWTFERLHEWFTEQAALIDEAEKTSPLPRAVDQARLDKLCVTIVESMLKDKGA